jgi:hypothetical protein
MTQDTASGNGVALIGTEDIGWAQVHTLRYYGVTRHLWTMSAADTPYLPPSSSKMAALSPSPSMIGHRMTQTKSPVSWLRSVRSTVPEIRVCGSC